MPSVMDVAPRAGIEKAVRGTDRASANRRDFIDILKSAGNPQKRSSDQTVASDPGTTASDKPVDDAQAAVQTDGESEETSEEDAEATSETKKPEQVKKKKQKDAPEASEATAETAAAPVALPGVAVENIDAVDPDAEQPEATLPESETSSANQPSEPDVVTGEGEAIAEDAMMQTLQATGQPGVPAKEQAVSKAVVEKSPASSKEAAPVAPVSADQTQAQPQQKESTTDQQQQPAAEVEIPAKPTDKPVATVEAKSFQAHLESADPTVLPTGTPDAASKGIAPRSESAPPAPPIPPERTFATNNHDRIITGMKAEVLPTGGEMKMRLDPPEIGVLQISVKVVNGTMTASFQTDNDKATQLLSHSLGRLKESLEAQGINVEKLQVQQAPKSEANSQQATQDHSRQNGQSGESAQQGWNQQQRRELLHRMQRRMLNGGDPLDLVA
jgi:flagellar hook-length control protein FliK